MNLKTVKTWGEARAERKRVGRGRGSGMGKTSTKGHKGQGQHSSGGRHKLGFEGGQMPFFRRLPKRGFSNFRFRKIYTIINVDRLNDFADGAQVDFEAIKKQGLISPEGDWLKVLGSGELKKKLNVTAHRFSESAKKKIEALGGKVTELQAPKPRKAKPVAKPAKPSVEEAKE